MSKYTTAFIIMLLLIAYAPGIWAQRAESLTVGVDTIIPVSMNTLLTTKNSQAGDHFNAEVILPITVGNTVAIPKGAVVTGRVAHVKRAGRIRGRAEMALAFDKIIFPDGYTADINVQLTGAHGRDFGKRKPGEEKITGDTSKGKDAVIVGNTTAAGAAVGAIAGGGKGLAIGSGSGAIVGVASVLATRGPDLVLERGTQLDLVLRQPFAINRAR